MTRHALAEPAADLDPAGIAGTLCGAHAQVLSAAELSIGRRIAGATRADVRRALWQERTLVKTFGPRGTVHLLPTADLAAMDRCAVGPAVAGTDGSGRGPLPSRAGGRGHRRDRRRAGGRRADRG
jgi:hypothetical protein